MVFDGFKLFFFVIFGWFWMVGDWGRRARKGTTNVFVDGFP